MKEKIEKGDKNKSSEWSLGETPARKRTYVPILSTVLVLLAIGAGVLYAVRLQNGKDDEVVRGSGGAFPEKQQYTLNELYEKPDSYTHGLLLFSLFDTMKPEAGVRPYTYNLDEKTFGFDNIMEGAKGEEWIMNRHVSFSFDGKYLTFVGFPSSRKNEKEAKAMQVYRGKVEGDIHTSEAIRSAFSNAERITDMVGEKRLPSINRNGDVLMAFSTIAAGNVLRSATSTHIFVIPSASSTPKFLAQGSKPRWVDESKFIYLSAEGITLFNYEATGSVAVLVPTAALGGVINDNIGIATSPDGHTFAVSNPEYGSLIVFRVDDWNNPGAMRVVTQYKDTYGFWPVFSPHGDIVALQTADRENLATNPHPIIRFYPVVDDVKKETVEGVDKYSIVPREVLSYTIDMTELGSFDQQQMFLTSWTY